jgi:transcriptional regulator with XRE-family HTH domain
MQEVTFGQYLRSLRLRAGFGLRRFADKIKMKPSNLCRMEAGRISPPRDIGIIRRIAVALGLGEDSAEYLKLNDLASRAKPGTIAPDVVEYVAGHSAVPILLRTARGKHLDAEQLRKLAEYIETHL